MIILGTNSVKDTGFDVANSVRMNRGDSPSFTRSIGSNGDFNNSTLSMWVKKCSNDIDTNRLWLEFENGTNYEEVRFLDNDTLRIYSESGGGTYFEIKTNRKFRDTNAFYHICVIYDYSQATNTNRIKLFINGVQETSFSTFSVPNQGANSSMNKSGNTVYVGAYPTGSNYFDGYLAEMVWLDGTSASVTDFGEFDEDSGIWKPINVSGLTAGTNGWYMDYESSGSLGNDVFGSNNFTVNNLTAIDQSTDTCTNNFSTFNSAQKALANTSFSEGNLVASTNSSASTQVPFATTIPVSTGKWYAEFKMIAKSTSSGSIPYIGILGAAKFVSALDNAYFIGGANLDGVGYGTSGVVYSNGSELDSSEATIANGDIVGIAADITNKKIYFSKNGTYINSQDPAAGSNGYTIPTTSQGFYIFAASLFGASGSWGANFGSPPYAISSGNQDGDGYGNFEYAVPSGYYALNTKNLAEYG